VHQVGFYYTDISRCTVNKTLKKGTIVSKIQMGTLPYCTGGSNTKTCKCHCLIRKSMILQEVVKKQFKINILTFV